MDGDGNGGVLGLAACDGVGVLDGDGTIGFLRRCIYQVLRKELSPSISG